MDILTTEEIDSLPSRHFAGYDWSEHDTVNQVIEFFLEDYTKWAREVDHQKRIKQKVELREHLKCFLLELYRTYKINSEMLLAISLGNETVSSYQKDRYRPSHITFRLINHVFNFLLYEKYIELPLGDKGRATGAVKHQRSTRVRASNELIILLEFFGFKRNMIGIHPNGRECIQLRRQKLRGQVRGDNEQYVDNQFTVNARQNLEKINSFIAQNAINLKISDALEEQLIRRIRERDEAEKPRYLDYSDNWLKRIFNNSSFDQGGRFYGGLWQVIPKEYRFLITINGDATREYDFSGMHFSILYAKIGRAVPEGDVYELDGYDKSLRGDIKEAFNIIVNCNTIGQAIGTINQKISQGELHTGLEDGARLVESFRIKHKPIAEYIASGEGVRLQFTDSQIAESVMLRGLERNVCILPMHDGFITSVKHETELQEFMQDAFREITGYEIQIKPEPIYPRLIEPGLKEIEPFVIDSDGMNKRLEEFTGNEATGYSSIVGVEHYEQELELFTGYYKREKELG